MTRATIIFVAWPLLAGRKWEGMAAIQGHKLPSWGFCEWTQRGTIQRHVPETQVGHHQLVEQRWEQLPGCESSPSRSSRPHPSRGWSGWRSWCKVACSLCSLFFQITSWCMALLSIICNPEDSSWVCSLSSRCLMQCHVHQNSLWYVVWTDCQGCGSPICAGLGLDLRYPVMLFNLILTISLFPWSFTWHHPHMNSLANRYSDSNFLSVLQGQEYRYLGRGLGFQHWGMHCCSMEALVKQMNTRSLKYLACPLEIHTYPRCASSVHSFRKWWVGCFCSQWGFQTHI